MQTPATIIIQARMASTRLPGKVLMMLGDRSVLAHLVTRAYEVSSNVIVATTVDASDDPIAAYCQGRDMPCFRGHPTDVLARYVGAADGRTLADWEQIVRLTADCPLVPAHVIRSVIAAAPFGVHYASNVTPYRTFPDGCDVEVFTMGTLLRAHAEATDPFDREHVTPWMRRHPELIKVCVSRHPSVESRRWTVDTREDLEYLRDFMRAVRLAANSRGVDLLGWPDDGGWLERLLTVESQSGLVDRPRTTPRYVQPEEIKGPSVGVHRTPDGDLWPNGE